MSGSSYATLSCALLHVLIATRLPLCVCSPDHFKVNFQGKVVMFRLLIAGVRDHRVLGNRSRSYLAMEQLEEALRDGEACCKLRPSWAKVRGERSHIANIAKTMLVLNQDVECETQKIIHIRHIE